MRGASWFALPLAALTLAAPASARDYQAECEALMARRSGAVVALEPASGRLLALVNPGLARQPAPPGSVFKLVTALAGLEAGVATPLSCRGRFEGRPCWKPGGHGRLTLEEAIAQSCNVYFYQLGERVGYPRLLAAARRAGLTQRGKAPPTIETAIGEGTQVSATALQMAGFLAGVATDGRPRQVGWTPGEPGAAFAPDGHLARLRAGMRAGVLAGSGRMAGSAEVAIAGKTGTATYLDGSNRTYGWFVGYAPAERPRLAVVVMLRDANGFGDAAPIGKAVIEAWLAAGRP